MAEQLSDEIARLLAAGEFSHAPNARLNAVEDVMDRLCVRRSTVFALLASGQLRSVKIGRRRLVPEQAIVEFIAQLDRDRGNDD
jgi:excisionase family DNA binding protein